MNEKPVHGQQYFFDFSPSNEKKSGELENHSTANWKFITHVEGLPITKPTTIRIVF